MLVQVELLDGVMMLKHHLTMVDLEAIQYLQP
jgi:hypothetical protein